MNEVEELKERIAALEAELKAEKERRKTLLEMQRITIRKEIEYLLTKI